MLDHELLKSTLLNASAIDAIYASLLAFILGVTIALTYVKTFNGLSFSRAYIQSLIFAPLLTSIAMQAIGDSLARGLGMMGAFSLLRFRTNIKDTRDMMFMFSSLTAGLACGVYSYSIGVIGVILFCVSVLTVYKIPFTSETDFDAVLRVQLNNDVNHQNQLDQILTKFAKRFSVVSLREAGQGQRIDLSYQLKLKNSYEQSQLIKNISSIESSKDIYLFMQDKDHEL